jgi:Superfamily I DNA and RNA helicases
MAREYQIKSAEDFTPQINYQAELNAAQYQAVSSQPGPMLVIAGAGSGKTRTLTYRVAYLVEHGVSPENILLLTFTNKAAKEMMRRVEDLVAHDFSRMWGGTFHHVGHRILRRNGDRIGLKKNFTIFDQEDSKDLVKA